MREGRIFQEEKCPRGRPADRAGRPAALLPGACALCTIRVPDASRVVQDLANVNRATR